MVRALRYRNYRLTGSAAMLGLVGFAGQIPSVVLTPLAGVVVDRWNQHRLLMATQVLSMLQSFALAALVFTGRMTIPALIALNVLQGLINAFDMPCRQSFVISLIENREDLANAIAMNSSMFNLARLIGPAVAGVVIAASGEGWRYVSGSVPIRTLMLLLAAVCLLGVPYGVLIPIFAGRVVGGGPHMLGLMMTASGAGALFAALWLASLRSIAGLGRALLASTAGFGLSLAGFGFMLLMAASNTIIQTIVDEDKRGRVMSFLMLAVLGTAPLGSLAVGAV
ncbi:MAG: MFS transporter, partial [Elusimicrobia bacterium]|nr:MFS transporter [Elusimicrobiota bacterium]